MERIKRTKEFEETKSIKAKVVTTTRRSLDEVECCEYVPFGSFTTAGKRKACKQHSCGLSEEFAGKKGWRTIDIGNETTTSKERCSRSLAKENGEASSNSRKRSCSDIDDIVAKRLRKDSELLGSEPRQILSEKLHKPYRTNQYRSSLLHTLGSLMYQLDLSVLCLIRMLTNVHKYPSLSLTFEDSEIDKFNNIVVRYKEKSVHIRIENVDTYYLDSGIGYSSLFSKGKQKFSINNYFDSFVQHVICNPSSSSNNIEYLIVYTNATLDLAKGMTLKTVRFKNFYPFKLYSINMDKSNILKDFLITNDTLQSSAFYQFCQDKTTREELSNRLEFSSAICKIIKERNLSLEFGKEIKEAFLDKLVFAFNQPSREELNSLVKSEIEENSKVQDDYITLQDKVLRDLTGPEKHKNLRDYISGRIYEFSLLISFSHSMFLHKNMCSINFEGKRCAIRGGITIDYRGRITYVMAHTTNSSIGYSQLFLSKQQGKGDTSSINKYFSFFVERLEENLRYFIIYTNAALDLTEENELKNEQSKYFYSLKFSCINIRKKRYKILRDCPSIDENGLYQFAQDETRERLFNLLKLPPSLQNEKDKGRFSNENEIEIKEKFLHKLIFAVNQPNRKTLNSVTRSEIDGSDVPYNYEKLHEIVLRWSESQKFSPITKRDMEMLLGDIENHRFTYQKIENKETEKTEFAKRIFSRTIETPPYYQFLDFLIKGEGKHYLEVLEREGIKLTSVSNILGKAKANAIRGFKLLYNLWFDAAGNKTQYLKSLEDNSIKLSTVSSILANAGANGAGAFKDLYDLWFDAKGNKTQLLNTLEKQGINLSNVSCIIGGSGIHAKQTFKDLYDLWFDVKGNKTQYLKSLEDNGIKLSNMSCILHKAGVNSVKGFIGLYSLWFNAEGNKTLYLKTLEENGINLGTISCILNGTKLNAIRVFKEFYNLWFDAQGNQSQYLKSLEENRIGLKSISGILSTSGLNAPKAFVDLHDLWFDSEGNKTQYLKTLEKEGIELPHISSILSGSGVNGANTFRHLYNLWFDTEGNKTQYLKTLDKNGIKLYSMSSILSTAGANAALAFSDLYDLWFNGEGNKTQYLKTLEKEGIHLSNISSILSGSGVKAGESFKDLYDLWFDAEGNKTQYLKTLEYNKINLTSTSGILNGSGANAVKAFKDLYEMWFDAEGNKTHYLKNLETNGISLSSVSSILCATGVNAAKAFKDLYHLWFDTEGNNTQYLNTLETNGINLFSVSSILCTAGVNAAKAFKYLYDLWFDAEGNKTRYLKTLEINGINFSNMSSILNKAGANAAKAFEGLHDSWFDTEGKKSQYLKILEDNEINISNISAILHGSGAGAVKAFKDLYCTWFDAEGNKTQYLKTFEENGIDLYNLSEILHGSGLNNVKAFKNLYTQWFDTDGNKTQYLKTLEKEGIRLPLISSILKQAGTNAAKAFEELYNLWFDAEGHKTQSLKTLEENGIDLTNISSILSRSGVNAAKAFTDLYNFCLDDQRNKTQCLKHFVEDEYGSDSFTIHNLSDILSGSGANAKDAFRKLHNVCFNDKGERTELLNDFYNAGFKASDLTSVLRGTGLRASSVLERLHCLCFDKAGNKTQILDDFFNAGFRPSDLCSILAGAAESLNKLHHFCFMQRTKRYLKRFLNEEDSFTISQICNILGGAEASVCSALTDLHDVYFDEAGNRTHIFDDFYRAGFSPRYLSKILFKAGNNVSSVLRKFHKICFNKRKYLHHFLVEKEIFTSKNLSKILDGAGLNIYPNFKTLHGLCFDKAGNRTQYLDNLIENNTRKNIVKILYEQVRKS